MRNAWHKARSVSRLAVGERRLDTTIGRCKVGLWRVSRWAERVGLGDCMALREVRWRSPSPSFDGFLERFLFFPQLTICTRNNSNPWGGTSHWSSQPQAVHSVQLPLLCVCSFFVQKHSLSIVSVFLVLALGKWKCSIPMAEQFDNTFFCVFWNTTAVD